MIHLFAELFGHYQNSDLPAAGTTPCNVQAKIKLRELFEPESWIRLSVIYQAPRVAGPCQSLVLIRCSAQHTKFVSLSLKRTFG